MYLNATACLVLYTKENLQQMNTLCKLKFAVILYVFELKF